MDNDAQAPPRPVETVDTSAVAGEATGADRTREIANVVASRSVVQNAQISHLAASYATRSAATIAQYWASVGAAARVLTGADPLLLAAQFRDFARDAGQRALLTLDLRRQAANAAATREVAGLRPVLAFDYDVEIDGTTLPRPVNYSLVRIRPPAGYLPTMPDLRPWVIIDPRSGQGSGIGGFKDESEVGIALAEGYPVYFVIFSQFPEPGQTLADVCAAEAAFLHRIAALHPDAARPFVTGNCQGGWATMILAATHPELTGPLVIAGVPLSPWAGRAGQNPLRHMGGWVGGTLPAALMADAGGGLFDGAALVSNFEGMNPGRDVWRRQAELFAEIETRGADFLDFDRWWSGFYFMNAAEIRWIVDNIFVGNRLARGLAVLDDGKRIDLARITAPIVVFASHGDAVSTVQQALRWIPDVWGSATRLREAGRTIIYTTDETATHLSLFVSASVADDHHRRIGSVMRTIESLPPGLYEMAVMRDETGETVHFEARDTDAILALCDPPREDESFAVAAEAADWLTRGYDLAVAPWVRAWTTPASARLGRSLNPMRLTNHLLSDANPVMVPVAEAADRARTDRHPVAEDNPFRRIERLWIDAVAHQFDLVRDLREAATEIGFQAIYAAPLLRPRPDLVAPFRPPAAAGAPDTAAIAVARIERGGYAEAIVRMCVFLSRAGGQLRQDRLERFSAMLQSRAPFGSMTAEARRQMIDEQSLIVDRAGPAARDTLMRLLRDDVDRLRAVNIVLEVMDIGPHSPPELIAEFEALQLDLRTRARNWMVRPEGSGLA